jgi:hypothetical protein
VLVLIGVGALVGCAGGPDDATSTSVAQDAGAPPVDLVRSDDDAVFVIDCPFSHRSSDDPIVHPGNPGASHSHDFFGSTVADADVTVDEMRSAGTTCKDERDTAAYWVPTLLRSGTPVDPTAFRAYYRAVPGSSAGAVQPIPLGLKMLAGEVSMDHSGDAHDHEQGDAHDHEQHHTSGHEGHGDGSDAATAAAAATEDRSLWGCGFKAERLTGAAPRDCTEENPLTMELFFADCWNGEDLDSPDHLGHVAYSTDGRCPDSHPVPILELQVTVQWPVWGDISDLALSSGPLNRAHGDFINAWDEVALLGYIGRCVGPRAGCPTDYTAGSAYQQCDAQMTLVAPITEAGAYCEATGSAIRADVSAAGAALVTKPGQATCEEVVERSGGILIGCAGDAFGPEVTEGAIGVACAQAPCVLALRVTRPVEFQAGLGGVPDSVDFSGISVSP